MLFRQWWVMVAVWGGATGSLHAGQESSPPSKPESPAMVWNGMKIDGKDLQLRCKCLPVPGRFHFTMEGNVKLTLFQGEIEVTATKIAIVMDGELPISVSCFGRCLYQDHHGDISVAGDTVKIANNGNLAFSNAVVTYGAGRLRTTAKAESLSIKDGEIKFTGSVSLRLMPAARE